MRLAVLQADMAETTIEIQSPSPSQAGSPDAAKPSQDHPEPQEATAKKVQYVVACDSCGLHPNVHLDLQLFCS